MSDASAVWARVGAQGRQRRGFDDDRCWVSHFALPTGAGGALSREPVTEDVRGTFAAIEAMAGWARTNPCDPANEVTRSAVCVIAGELEAMARAIRDALGDNETETP